MDTAGRSIGRSRWAAIGAAIAVALGAGGLLAASAADSSAPGTFVAITPCRVVDTRPAPDNVGPRTTPIGNGETYSTAFVGAVGKCNIPADAVAVVLNLAIVDPTADSYLTAFPAGGTVPLAANLNFVAHQAPVSNAATVRIGDGGKLSFYNLRGSVDVTADVSGYYVPHTDPTTVPTTPAPTTQQIVYSSRAVDWYNSSAAPSSYNGCTAMNTGTNFGVVPLNLPVGASVASIAVVVFDGATSSAYQIVLNRQRTTSSGIQETDGLLTIAGGSSNNSAVTSVAGASSSFPVTATDSYWLDVNLGNPGANAFCSATVNVTMP